MPTQNPDSFLDAGGTLSDIAAQQIRAAILSGSMAPGSKIHIKKLADTLGFSPTPMREALSRLASSGLVEASGQKGFRVVSLSWRDLEDIQSMRLMIESEALQRAIKKGGLQWESSILYALNRLKNVQTVEPDPESADDYDPAHKDFHTALLAACDSPRLLSLQRELNDQVYRYRILLRARPRPKQLSDRIHENLATLVLSRDSDAAVRALRSHIEETSISMRKVPPEALKKWLTDA